MGYIRQVNQGLPPHEFDDYVRGVEESKAFGLTCDYLDSRGSKLAMLAFSGSNGGSPFVCERSAEAESPGACQPLYALRSHSKPPPGFGANPDPIAEQAAREAHARTIGPLKKRLKVQCLLSAPEDQHLASMGEPALNLRPGAFSMPMFGLGLLLTYFLVCENVI